jgi:hypothetical protein
MRPMFVPAQALERGALVAASRARGSIALKGGPFFSSRNYGLNQRRIIRVCLRAIDPLRHRPTLKAVVGRRL